MKRLLLLASVAMIFAPIGARAQTTVQTTVRVVGTCGSGVTWTAGKMNFPTVDTTGVLCTNSSGGGGGASYTAASAPFSVAAGTNKPAGIDTANSAQFTELCKPGTTTCVDPTAPAVLAGVDASTAASAANPLPVLNNTSACPNNPIPISQTTSTDLKTFTNTGYICSVVLTNATSTQTWSLVYGTGSVCGTGTTGIIGGTSASATGSIASLSSTITLQLGASAKHLCLLQGGSTNISGSITYADK